MNKSKFYAELIIIMEFEFAHRVCVCDCSHGIWLISIYKYMLPDYCKSRERERERENIYISSPGGVLSVSSTHKTRPLPIDGHMWTSEQTHTHTHQNRLKYMVCAYRQRVFMIYDSGIRFYYMILQFRKLHSHVITNFCLLFCWWAFFGCFHLFSFFFLLLLIHEWFLFYFIFLTSDFIFY